MPKLTDALVKAILAPAGSAKIVYDDQVKGFGIRVTPAGAKTFILRYRNETGTERKMRIGGADAWSTAAARDEAKRLLREEVNVGVDPLEERVAIRGALTVDEVLDRYLASARFADKAPSTQSIDRGRLDRHVRPLLGKKQVETLTLDQIERAFADIRDGKTAGRVKTRRRGLARVTGGEGTARAAMRLLRAALSWAVRERLVASNPAVGINIGKDGVRKLILDPAGYRAMFEALERLEDQGRIKSKAADTIRVIALTGARRGEIVGLRREYLDHAGEVIVLPASRHKTGKSTGDERIIALPLAAQEIVRRQPENEVIFGIDLASLTKAWALVRKEAKLTATFGLHGLRHSVASHLAMSGAGAAEIMTALGHRQMSTSQKYVHWIHEGRKRLAERAAAVALTAMRAPAD